MNKLTNSKKENIYMEQGQNHIDLFFKKIINYYNSYNNIISKNQYLESFPLEIFFEVSNLCNINCIFCAAHYNKGKKGYLIMKLDYLEKIYKSGFVDYSFFAHLHGFGEPFLNKNIIKFIQLIKSRDCSIDFFTNGSLITNNVAQKLVDHSVEKITFSFYGGTRETYNYLMKNSDFDTVLDNLKYLYQYKKQVGSEYPEIILTLAVMKSNFKELPKIAEIAASLGSSTLRIDHLIVYDFIPNLNDEYKKYNKLDYLILLKTRNICKKNNIQFLSNGFTLTRNIKRENIKTSSSKSTTITFLKKISDNLHLKKKPHYQIIERKRLPKIQYNEYSPEELFQLETGVKTRNNETIHVKSINNKNIDLFKNSTFPFVDGYTNLNDQDDNYYKKISKSCATEFPVYCFQPFTNILITYDGKVKPCCFWRDDYPGFELGDLTTQGIDEIWNSNKFQGLREIIIKGLVHFSCYNCITSGSMPINFGYPNTSEIKKISDEKILNHISRNCEVIASVSAKNNINVEFTNLTIDTKKSECISATSTNNDPQILFKVNDKNVFVFIKIRVNQLITPKLEIFYAYENEKFNEKNKIYLSLKEGENFFWCFIPNEKNIPIKEIRIDPISEIANFDIHYIIAIKPLTSFENYES